MNEIERLLEPALKYFEERNEKRFGYSQCKMKFILPLKKYFKAGDGRGYQNRFVSVSIATGLSGVREPESHDLVRSADGRSYLHAYFFPCQFDSGDREDRSMSYVELRQYVEPETFAQQFASKFDIEIKGWETFSLRVNRIPA
jgi:hypothetical protein